MMDNFRESLYLLFSISIICIVESASPTTFKIELQKLNISTFSKNKILNDFSDKPKVQLSADQPPKKEEIILKNINNALYIANITVGNPPKVFRMKVNTRVGDMWTVSSEVCSTDSTYCKTHQTYNKNKSDTYVKDGRDFYTYGFGDSFTSGNLNKDDISIGKLKIKRQLFGEVTNFNPTFLGSDVDGVLGLGYKSDVNLPNVDTLIANIIKQKLIENPVFSVYLSRSQCLGKSELIFGGVNEHRFKGEFKFIPMHLTDYYWIQIDRFLYGNEDFGGPYWAILDTSVAGIVVPSKQVTSLNRNLSPSLNEEDGLYYVGCNRADSFKPLIFRINGITFTMHPEEYLVKRYYEKGAAFCWTGFTEYQEFGIFLLGDTFLQTYYAQFDLVKKQIGLAKAINYKS